MRLNSSEIISRLISLTFLLSADPNITDLLRREHPLNFSPNRSGVGKSGMLRTKAAISLKRVKKDRGKVTMDGL